MNQNFDLSQISDEQLLQFVNTNPELKAQYDRFLMQQREQRQNSDPKTKPLTDREYLKVKDIKEYLDPEGGLVIEPTPQYVMKGFEEKTNEKVFINVVTHSVIDEPEQKQMVDMDNQEGVRVPMSVGNVKEDNDKRGEICKVIDIVVHPNVAKSIHQNQDLRQFFCSLIQSYFFQKFKLQLKEQFTFPKMKYKGRSMQFQRVKGKKPPKIQVVSEEIYEDQEESINKKKLSEQEQFESEMFDQMNRNQVLRKVQEPEWELFFVYQDGRVQEFDGDYDLQKIKESYFEIKLPLLVTGKGIDLQVGKDFFCLVNPLYEIACRFPFDIIKQSIKATFSIKRRVLQIRAEPEVMEIQSEEETTPIVPKVKFNVNVQLENNLLYDIV